MRLRLDALPRELAKHRGFGARPMTLTSSAGSSMVQEGFGMFGWTDSLGVVVLFVVGVAE